MTDHLARFAEADGILSRALDLSPHERDPFLEAACGQDQELRDLLDRLLVAGDGADSSLVPGGAMRGMLARDLCTTLVSELPVELSPIERLLARVLPPETERLSFGEEVAQGGMATIEMVIDRALERRMARKVLRADLRQQLRAGELVRA